MITRVNRRLSDPSNNVQTLAPITVTDTHLASDETAVKEPEDPEVKRAADKLAAFVAARGRAAEEGARAKNPGGDTPFRFLHDKTCNDYRYYESKIAEAKGGEKSDAGASNAPAPARPAAPAATTPPGIPPPPPPPDDAPRRRSRWGLAPGERAPEAPAQRPNSGWDAGPAPQRRTPGTGPDGPERTAADSRGGVGGAPTIDASGDRSVSPDRPRPRRDERRFYHDPRAQGPAGITAASRSGFADGTPDGTPDGTRAESAGGVVGFDKDAAARDPLRAMEFFAQRAAREEKWREDKRAERERAERERSERKGFSDPVPGARLDRSTPAEAEARRMGVNRPIRQEEIDAKYDALGRRGHHMDQFVPEHERVRMMAAAGDPAAQAAQAKQAIEARLNGGGGGGGGGGLGYNPLERKGLGASDPTAPSSQDDIYEQYKKRMSTGYRYRPNPLGNPRKQYY